MERIGHVWRVKPGRAADYDRMHRTIWPELEQILRQAGVERYTIYRWGDIAFSHMEAASFERVVERFNHDPVAQRWEKVFAEVIEYPNADPGTGWPERLKEVWTL